METPTDIPTLKQFIQTNFDWYKLDKFTSPVVRSLGLWALRQSSFETEKGNYLDKGILLTGKIGTGKTDLMRLLKLYLMNLYSPYSFKPGIVWAFADRYKEEGFNCFNQINISNWFFDELGLTDENNVPTKEIVNNYGNKILVGHELILKRYNAFKNYGYQTHFTTNLTPKQLKDIYGERCFSRLIEMCNFIDFPGIDRRFNSKPVFYSNKNEYIPPAPQIPKEKTDAEVKAWINDIYLAFVATGDTKGIYPSLFEILHNHGVSVATGEQLRILKFDVETRRLEQIKKPAGSMEEAKRFKKLQGQYAANKLDREETDHLWHETKKLSVINYYTSCKNKQVQSIF